MTESVILPTRKDEAWRYSDTDALAGMDLGTFDRWRDIEVAAGEGFTECFVLDGGDGVELTRLRVKLGEGATAALFAVVAGGDLGRLEIVVTMAKGAHFELGGVVLGGDETTREIVTRIAHEEPDATSNQVIRAVAWGQATGNFLGRIDVVRDAQRTDAAQSFKGLLLERGASVNSVPQLEIFADDVKCEHGAAIGQLDEQARYYMAARGIAPDAARRLLVQAFLGDAFVAMKDEDARERMMDLALGRLAGEL